jgi:hypothetical protein
LISALKKLFFTIAMLLILGGALAACIEQPKRPSQERLLDIVWTDFRPNTSSQNRGNWDNIQISLVSGREVVGEFSAVPASQCPGPALPENRAIRASSQYWFVKVAPKPIILTDSDVAPTVDEVIVPEALIDGASYLVDSTTGEIVARRFFCER